MKKLLWTSLSVVGMVIAVPVPAHHSFAMYDQQRDVVLTGTATEFQWTNPHGWIELDVPGKDGSIRHWSIETGSIGVLARQGWNSTVIKPGDAISVLINPLRNGESGGTLQGVIFANGKTHGKRIELPPAG